MNGQFAHPKGDLRPEKELEDRIWMDLPAEGSTAAPAQTLTASCGMRNGFTSWRIHSCSSSNTHCFVWHETIQVLHGAHHPHQCKWRKLSIYMLHPPKNGDLNRCGWEPGDEFAEMVLEGKRHGQELPEDVVWDDEFDEIDDFDMQEAPDQRNNFHTASQGCLWMYTFTACFTSLPVSSHRSSPRCQYSYWALRILARRAMEGKAWSGSEEVYPLSTAMHSRCAECQHLQKAVCHQEVCAWRHACTWASATGTFPWPWHAFCNGRRHHEPYRRACELAAFGGVAVQDNLAILQVFDCQRFPVDFADRTWPRSSFHSQRWAHTAQHQCLGLPSLHKARPSFPLHTFLALYWLNVATKGWFVCFSISPRAAVAEDDLLLSLHVRFWRHVQAFAQGFIHLVVDVKEKAGSCSLDASETKKEQSSLQLQGLVSAAGGDLEQRVQVVRHHELSTFVGCASVLQHIMSGFAWKFAFPTVGAHLAVPIW